MNAAVAAAHPKARSSRVWFLAAAVAALVAIVAWWQWWSYQNDLQAAAKAYRFKYVEVVLTQPPFEGIATQIEGDKWLADGPRDIVREPDPIALYDTITLKLEPLTTGTQCAPSNILTYDVVVDAPGFTVDNLGNAARSRADLLAPACSLAAKPPPSPAPWRWNLMATRPGNHVVTMLLTALDKNQNIVDSREVDIPVFVPSPPLTLAAVIGLVSTAATIVATLIGLWQRFRPKSALNDP